MIVLQTIAVAFAMFSAVPVPQFEWNAKNMRYALCAFPLIGVVIGALWCLCGALPLPAMAKAAGFCLLPVWVTGGIHLDGYADTCDALSSYGDTAQKLEILKDPHCGAFAVIRLCSYFIAYLALCVCVQFTPRVGVLWTLALVGERALSGLAGVVLAARVSSGQSSMGMSYELDAIAAAVIGGSSLMGGVGRITGTLIGAMILGLIKSGFTFVGVDAYVQDIIKGIIIVAAVTIDMRRNRKKH